MLGWLQESAALAELEDVELRAKWEPGIEALSPALGFRMEEVDRAGSKGRAEAAPWQPWS